MGYLKQKVQTPNIEQLDKNMVEEEVRVGPLEGMSEADFIKLAESILVAVPYRYPEGINASLCDKFGIWARMGTPISTIRDPHGGFIEVMRAGIARTFLDYCNDNPKCKYLVMIDNDEGVDWDAPYRLASHDKPVVSGVVCAYSHRRGIYACFTVPDKKGIPRFPSINYTRMIPSRGLVKAHQVGTGLICIRKDVLETLYHNDEIPFYLPEDIRRKGAATGDLVKGEDIVFSEQCEKYGFDRYVDLAVRAPHFKTLPLSWPLEQIRDDLSVEDWDVSPDDYGVIGNAKKSE